MSFRYAICSEIFKEWDIPRACRTAASLGYTGFEVAPFTLAESVIDISPARRREILSIIEDAGMVCSGIHWLLVSPKGLHLTTHDAALRTRSWDYMARLVDFCGDLGGPIMVFGSPYQRSASGDLTVAEAMARLAEGLSALAPRAAERGITILMEAVSSKETNVVSTMAEAAEIVRRVGHPSIQTMFDVHNSADEGDDYLALLSKYYEMIRHVHVNEVDGRHPGTGSADFARLFADLRRLDYRGWISLEVFDFSPGPEAIASETIDYLKRIEDSLA